MLVGESMAKAIDFVAQIFTKIGSFLDDTDEKIQQGIDALPGLRVIGEPVMSVFAFGAEEGLDIGAVGFASDRRVVDLMGLVSPEILALGAEMGFEEMVASGAWVPVMTDMPAPEGHRYLIDRTADGPRWDGRVLHGFRFELMDTCILRGVGLREPQPWTVALYRLVSTETGVRSSDGG